MGLAASQARFLAITSRKASCEFQSMQIAQQQLSLSRDMEKISDEYQEAINKTTLIWDPDGRGTSIYDLSYGIMMRPSDLNNKVPFMLSRRDGKIALNDSYAAAAAAAGIPETGFSGTAAEKAELYTKFVCGLNAGNVEGTKSKYVLDADGVAYIQDPNGIEYITNAGLGGELYGREFGTYVTITSLISFVDSLVDGVTKGSYPLGSDMYNFGKALICDISGSLKKDPAAVETPDGEKLPESFNEQKKNTKVGIFVNGNYHNGAFSIADLLNEDITLGTVESDTTKYAKVMESLRTVLKNSSQAGFDTLVNRNVEDWYDGMNGKGAFDSLDNTSKAMLVFADSLAKGMNNLLVSKPPSDSEINSFYLAMDDVLNRMEGMPKASTKASESNLKTSVQDAEKYNKWTSSKNAAAISLSNLTEAFLTTYENSLNGYSSQFIIKDKVKESTYITDDPGFLYQINNDNAMPEEYYKSEFYSCIFNTICQNGWYKNENVDDNDYLTNAIKSGQLFVVSKNKDNYFYQERYIAIDGGHIMENTDCDAVARAEREYVSKKAKINTKEEQLEIETKQLDAEIAALSTEYDTVKSLISKNIEKTFTLFNN